jgi:hypothetical protein|tara:strand:+ start:1628 stop:1834 length:207 start_codon:yes stop_codon:yes gene_type:complete
MDNKHPQDLPEGKMEMSLRVLGNELIGIKMTVDDFKMKWLAFGVIAIVVVAGAVSAFGPAIAGMMVSG